MAACGAARPLAPLLAAACASTPGGARLPADQFPLDPRQGLSGPFSSGHPGRMGRARARDLRRAREQFEKAEARQPGLASRIGLIEVLVLEGSLPEALAACGQMLARARSDGPACSWLAARPMHDRDRRSRGSSSTGALWPTRAGGRGSKRGRRSSARSPGSSSGARHRRRQGRRTGRPPARRSRWRSSSIRSPHRRARRPATSSARPGQPPGRPAALPQALDRAAERPDALEEDRGALALALSDYGAAVSACSTSSPASIRRMRRRPPTRALPSASANWPPPSGRRRGLAAPDAGRRPRCSCGGSCPRSARPA